MRSSSFQGTPRAPATSVAPGSQGRAALACTQAIQHGAACHVMDAAGLQMDQKVQQQQSTGAELLGVAYESRQQPPSPQVAVALGRRRLGSPSAWVAVASDQAPAAPGRECESGPLK